MRIDAHDGGRHNKVPRAMTPLYLPRPQAAMAGRPTPRPHLAKGRAIHLIDVENLLGGPRFTKADVLALAQRYQHVANPTPASLMVAATSSSTGVVTTGIAWPDIRCGWRPGHDGADLVLLDVLREERIAERFESVILASGDAIFAPAVRDLRDQGLDVTVIARPTALSSDLRIAAGSDHVRAITPGDAHGDA